MYCNVHFDMISEKTWVPCLAKATFLITGGAAKEQQASGLYLRDCPASPSWKLWPERRPARPHRGPSCLLSLEGTLDTCLEELLPVLWLKA